VTATIAGPRPDQEAERTGFGRVLRAEWTKFRTVRGWMITVVLAALLTAGIGLWVASGGQSSCGLVLPGGGGTAQGCPAAPLGPGGEAVTDSFYFVRQPLRGAGAVTVRITSLTGGNSSDNPGGPLTAGLQPWAKAGVIVEGGRRPGAPYAAVLVTGAHGVRMQYDYTGDLAGLPGPVSAAAPRWLRLTRSGDVLTGSDSPDGRHWTRVGQVSLAGLPATVQVGLFAASPDAVATESGSPTQATATFDHVSLSGVTAPGAWRGAAVGAGAAAGPLAGGFQQAAGRFTVSGSGDIAPAVANSSTSSKPADQGLIGAFAGLIAVIVVGAVYMTAEYRRGLIRATLAASPRRGQVLAAKAIVIGAVTFAAGLVSAVVAVPLGDRLMAGHGRPAFPAGPLTEARAIVGTAALLAVAAVFALALGTIMRQSAGPVTAAIALIVVPFFFSSPLAVLPPGAGDWLLRATPAAGFAVQQVLPQYAQVSNAYIPQFGYYPLAPWAGFAVLCAWAAAALAVAYWLLRRRDA